MTEEIIYKESETDFPANLWKTGSSLVITIPKEALKQLNLGEHSGVMVHIRKWAR